MIIILIYFPYITMLTREIAITLLPIENLSISCTFSVRAPHMILALSIPSALVIQIHLPLTCPHLVIAKQANITVGVNLTLLSDSLALTKRHRLIDADGAIITFAFVVVYAHFSGELVHDFLVGIGNTSVKGVMAKLLRFFIYGIAPEVRVTYLIVRITIF